MPELAPDEPIRLVADWACEILSPSTARTDHTVKRPFWARSGLPWLWFLDPGWRTLTVFRLVDGKWTDHQLFTEGGKVRAEPFDEVELDLDLLWLPEKTPTPPAKKARPAKKKTPRRRKEK